MKKMTILMMSLISILLICFPALSTDEYTYYEPITEIDLGVKKLELNVGDIYVFPMRHKPENTPEEFISWLTDNSILQADPAHRSVTAIAAGTTRLLVESNAGFTWDYCDITVLGPEGKDAGEKMAGKELITLSSPDREKIKAKTVLNYLSFLENSSFTSENLDKITNRQFNVTALVKPGTVETERVLAASLGMEKSLPLPDLNAVSLRGTITQILAFTNDNANLIQIIEFAPMNITDPVFDTEPDTVTAKSTNLGSHVDSLTRINYAHNYGYTGAGTAIAVIDTGLNKDHEQFEGRVIAEGCYGLSTSDGYHPVCSSGSSEPSNTQSPLLHNHGSHVTGIAAGRDGIAPDALIVSVNISVESCNGSNCVETLYWSPYEVFQYLKDLQDSYYENNTPLIAAVNMSLGSGLYDHVCDSENTNLRESFDLLVENNMVPVVASGNNGSNGSVSSPACLSNAFSVGALDNKSTPTIANFSNHSPQVDILAPGTVIYSALYAYENDNMVYDSTCRGSDCYGKSQGTSQATPMVTGAFAILRQANADLSVSELETKLTAISSLSSRKKVNGTTFGYAKPILDFANVVDRTPAESITITDEDGSDVTEGYITLDSGVRSYQLQGSISPNEAVQIINWSSNDPDIATVDRNGLVTFHQAGSAYIYASSSDLIGIYEYVVIELEPVYEEGDCGTNVKYLVDGNTIVFYAGDNGNAVLNTECTDRFRNDDFITDVTIDDTIGLENGLQLFAGAKFVRTMNLNNLDVSGVSTMQEMFSGCESLTSLYVSSWQTDNVVNMKSMFADCAALTDPGVSGWNTGNVTDMSGMFAGCTALTDLDVSGWETGKVEDMSDMFYNCSSLESLDVDEWETDSVTNMSGLFRGCEILNGLVLENWNTSGVTDMSWMFADCFALDSLDIGGWETGSVTDMSFMFGDCESLESLEIGGWSTGSVTDMSGMFAYCLRLNSLDLGEWDTSGVTEMTGMFFDCESLESLNISGWNTENVLLDVDDGWVSPSGSDSVRIFDWCLSLKRITLGKNTRSKNIFLALPYYNATWYYKEWANDVSDPMPLESPMPDGSLFTDYDPDRMAGTWSTIPLAKSITIRNSGGTDITGKTVTSNATTYQLKANANPAAAVQTVTWKSSNTSIATVSSTGKVTFKKTGTVTITATAADGTGISAKVTLKLLPKATKIIIKNSKNKVITGKKIVIHTKTYKLKVKVLPKTAAKTVTWKSSNKKIATVNSSGKVTFKKQGTVTITATSTDRGKKKATVKLTYKK